MMSVRQLSLAPIAALLFAVGGCEDGVSPADLGTLDATALTAGLDGLVDPLRAGTEAIANLRIAASDLSDAGVELRTTTSPVGLRLFGSTALQPRTGPAQVATLPAEFPPEVVGRTFGYDTELEAWAVDETRAGAPADGVRVLWYDLNSAGGVILPPNEMGHSDLEPHEAGPAGSLAVRIVETDESGGTITLVDLVQGGDSDGDVVVTETFSAEGIYSDGLNGVDFMVESNAVTDTNSQDEDYDLRVTMDGAETRYDMRVEGMAREGGERFEDVWSITAVNNGATTTVDLIFLRTDSDDNVTGTLTHDGQLLANIGATGNSYTFATPDGGSFSPGQSNELNAVLQAMTVRGVQVLFALPLFGLPLFLL